MEQHIKSKCRAAYAQLYNIGKYLDHQSAEKLIHTLVHSHVDYSNVLQVSLPKYIIKKLQMMQNTAARVLCRVGKYDNITPTLKRLHWLPVEFCIKHKICLLSFNALNGCSPQYLSEMLITRNVHYGLRSHEAPTLNIPKTKWKTLGDRAEWNSLPEDVRSSNDVSVFKRKLKTHYFTIAYN